MSKKRLKGRWILFVLPALFVLFLFRHTLFTLSIRSLLALFFSSHTVHFSQASWSNGKLFLSQVTMEEGGCFAAIDSVEIAPAISIQERRATAVVTLQDPKFVLEEVTEESLLHLGAPLSSSPYFSVHFLIPQGELTVGLRSYSFVMHQAPSKELELSIFDAKMPDSLIRLTAAPSERGWQAALSFQYLQKEDLEPIFSLLSLHDWEPLQGVVEGSASLSLSHNFQVEEFHGEVLARGFSAVHSALGLTLSCPEVALHLDHRDQQPVAPAALASSLTASLTLHDSKLTWTDPFTQNEGSCFHLEGTLLFGEEPSLSLGGVWQREEKLFPFSLTGKKADRSFLAQIHFEDKAESRLLVTHQALESQRVETEVRVENLDPDLIAVCQEAASFYFPQAAEVEIHEGVISAAVKLSLQEGKLVQLQVSDAEGSGIKLQVPSRKWLGFIEGCKANAVIDFTSEHPQLSALDLFLEQAGADVVQENGEIWNFSNLFGHFQLRDGIFNHSFLKGSFLGLEGEIIFPSSAEFSEARFELHCLADQILSLFSQEGAELLQGEEIPVLIKGDLFALDSGWKISSLLSLGREEKAEEISLTALWKEDRIVEGHFFSNKISSPLFSPFLRQLVPGLSVDGSLAMQGHFTPVQLDLSFLSSDLSSRYSSYQAQIKEKPLQGELHIHLDSGKWHGKMQAPSATLFLSPKSLDFSQQIAFSGDREGGWSLKADISQGSLAINETLTLDHLTFSWEMDHQMQESRIRSLSAQLHLLQKESFQISSTVLLCSSTRGEGDLLIKNDSEEILLSSFLAEKAPSGWRVSLQGSENRLFQSPFTFEGLFSPQQAELQTAHFTLRARLEKMMQAKALLERADLLPQPDSDLSCLQKMRVEGDLSFALTYSAEPSLWLFQAKAFDLSWNNTLFRTVDLSGKRTESQWIIDSLQLDDLQCRASLQFTNSAILLDHFEVKQGILTCQGSARTDLNSNQMQGEATLSLQPSAAFPWALQSQEKSPFTLTFDKGIALSHLTLFFPDRAGDQLRIPELFYDFKTQELKVDHLQFVLSDSLHPLLQQSSLAALKGSGSLLVRPDKILFRTKSLEAETLLAEKRFSAKELFFKKEPHSLFLSVKAYLDQTPLQLDATVDLQRDLPIDLCIKDPLASKEKGLFISLRRTEGAALQLEKISGEIKGIAMQLQRKSLSGPLLVGTISLQNESWRDLLPLSLQESLQQWSFGSGYQLTGEWNLFPLFSFRGEVVGKECRLFDYQVASLFAFLSISPTQCSVKELAVQDEAGEMQVKQIVLSKESSSAPWAFSIPSVQIKNLHPSFLRKWGKEIASVKPFVVRRLTFSQIKGKVGFPTTYSGEGKLYFTNAFSKEESKPLLSAIEAIKNLGLDPALLTPVEGEIDLQLKGDRLLLLQLVNAFSEKKRSQFYLSPAATSYIDLKGNLHIDLQMKQNVVFKPTESLILGVRGTLEKPRYSFR